MVNCMYLCLGYILRKGVFFISSSLDHKFMIAYALTLYLLLETLQKLQCSWRQCQPPSFEYQLKAGGCVLFQFFKFCSQLITYLTLEVTLDARHLTCAASGFQFCLTPKHPAAQEKKKSLIPRVGLRFQLARIDCVNFEIET